MTRTEARRILRDYQPDNMPLVDGFDPYNSADHRWNRWLLALSVIGPWGIYADA